MRFTPGLALVGLLLAVAGCQQLAPVATTPTPPTPVALDGEFVDLHCYLDQPDQSRGFAHSRCATRCIQRGQPVGFLSGGHLYLALRPDQGSINTYVDSLAGDLTTVQGVVMQRDGMDVILVHQIAGIALPHDLGDRRAEK